LEVFRLAVEYSLLCYEVTAHFPRSEAFGMTSNLRRAATSIASNIAEGSGRGTDRDFRHFLDIATGSLFETVAGFILADRLGYLRDGDLDRVRKSASVLGKKLNSFKRTLSSGTSDS